MSSQRLRFEPGFQSRRGATQLADFIQQGHIRGRYSGLMVVFDDLVRIFLVCSAANLSTYCVTAHCEIVRMLHLEGPEPEQIAIDHVHAKIPMADKALLNFCAKAAFKDWTQ